MPDSGGARALDVHNDFFLAILDRCQIRLSNHRGAPVFMGTGGSTVASTGGSTVASTGGRGTVSNFEVRDNPIGGGGDTFVEKCGWCWG